MQEIKQYAIVFTMNCALVEIISGLGYVYLNSPIILYCFKKWQHFCYVLKVLQIARELFI